MSTAARWLWLAPPVGVESPEEAAASADEERGAVGRGMALAEGGPPSKRELRPELFAAAGDKLSAIERMNLALVRATFELRPVDRLLQLMQRYVGATWIHYCTRHVRDVYGLERISPWEPSKSFIIVANHRSFFDMFVINAVLFREGWSHRLLFPVRANFFYDHPLGFLVNGVMSFWSMYPPIFRERKKAALNHASWNELALALRGGRSAGIHPEGTRKRDDDPYTFLPAQSGVGRLIHSARVAVLPVFINGLGNDLVKQVAGNFTRKGDRVIVVFGAPVELGGLLDEPPTGRTYKLIAERTLEEIGKLGQEERAIRAKLSGGRA